MKRLHLVGAALACAVVSVSMLSVSPAEAAAAPTFSEFERARATAAKSGKFAFLLCYADVPGDPTTAKAEFEGAVAKDAEIAKIAQSFELGYVDCFDTAFAQTNQCVNPKLEKKYGWPVTVAVYAPGAVRPMWSKAASKDGTNGRHRFTQDECKGFLAVAGTFATEAEYGKKALLDNYNAKKLDGPEIKKNSEALLQVSEYYARQYRAVAAIECIELAIPLIEKEAKAAAAAAKKAGGDDGVGMGSEEGFKEHIQDLTLQCAEVALESWEWKIAADRYRKFLGTYKDSEQMGTANIQLAKALAGGEDFKGAIAQCQAICKNKKLEAVQDEARKLQTEYETAMAKN